MFEAKVDTKVYVNDEKYIDSLEIYDSIRETVERFTDDLQKVVRANGKDVKVHVTLEFIE